MCATTLDHSLTFGGLVTSTNEQQLNTLRVNQREVFTATPFVALLSKDNVNYALAVCSSLLLLLSITSDLNFSTAYLKGLQLLSRVVWVA